MSITLLSRNDAAAFANRTRASSYFAAAPLTLVLLPLLGLAGLVAALVAAWPALLSRRLDGKVGAGRARRSRRPRRRLLPATPTGAVMAKELRQWVRDPGTHRRVESRLAVGCGSMPFRDVAWFPCHESARSEIALLYMATFRSASTLLSSDGTRTPGTAALFAEPARNGGTPPWAGDFRLANGAGNGPKNAVGKTFTLELPDGSTGKVVVQSLKNGKGGVILALMGEDAPPF